MQRVAIIGISGSGKSTLGRQLAPLIDATYLELDALYWQANWTPLPFDELQVKVAVLFAENKRWVVDGNYSVLQDWIFSQVDTVIWLDYPLYVTFWRLWQRSIKRHGEILWNGNREDLRSQFFNKDSLFRWAFKKHFDYRKTYPLKLARLAAQGIQILHFKSPKETEAWLKSVLASPPF